MTTPEPPIRVLIVEDHFLARFGLRGLIDDQPDMQVVGEATTCAEAIAEHARLRPDVVLMDVMLPDGDGIATTAQLRRADPEACVLVVTNSDGSDHVRGALAAGASGYLKKDAEGDEFVAAIRAGDGRLAPREHRVLELVFKGLSNREIAETMSLTPGTVRVYVSALLAKLGVRSRTEAVAVALDRGLLRP
jgi:DNA-binding NarL/FixJ family response regulator